MILQKVRLRGFLGHRGESDGNGGFNFCAVDFERSSLWLIHGRNGAGKSSIFDAIWFALYGVARDGKSIHRERLIHQACDSAHVELEIELGGARYLIQRNLKRRGQARMTSLVQRREGDEWVTVADSLNKAEAWAERALGVDHRAFCYSVLLRQGETGAFLDAKPDQRRETLMHLLSLKSFERLSGLAHDEFRDAKAARAKSEARLADVEPVTDDALAAQDQAVQSAKDRAHAASQALEDAKFSLAQARLSEEYIAKIERAKQQQGHDQPLLERADEINASVKRARELERAVPQIQAVRLTQIESERENKALQQAQTRVVELEGELRAAQGQLAAAEGAATEARLEHERSQSAFDGSERALLDAKSEAEVAGQIEKLLAQQEGAARELDPLRRWLDRAGEIEANARQADELAALLPLLRDLSHAQQAQVLAAGEHEQAEQVLEAARIAFEGVQEAEAAAEQAEVVARQAVQEEKRLLEAAQTEREILRGVWQNRRQVDGQDDCPFCGSELHSPESHERLHLERQQQEARASELETQIVSRSAEVERLEQEARGAHQRYLECRKAAKKADTAAGQAQAKSDAAQHRLNERQEAENEARRKCGDHALRLAELPDLELKAQKISGAGHDRSELQKAQLEAKGWQAKIDVWQGEISKLPQWTQEEREERRNAVQIAELKSKGALQVLVDARAQSNAAQAQAEAARKMTGDLDTDLKLASHSLESRQAASVGAQNRLHAAHDLLSQPWREHASLRDEAALEALRRELESLSEAEAEEADLSTAQKRVGELVGTIGTLQEQLDAVRAEHRRPVAQAEAAQREAHALCQGAEEEHRRTERLLADMEARAKNYAALQAELEAAQREERIDEKLDRALGKTRLQAEIIQKAQNQIAHAANQTLGRLTSYEWQVELRDKNDGAELDIIARHTSTNGERPFENLSGGEKFLVSVSLAVAIGRAASNGAPMNTLIIDEGFGALDAANRDSMVDELHRLSTDLLDNGRVVVVSHQEDVRERFDNRYHVQRDENGLVTATAHR